MANRERRWPPTSAARTNRFLAVAILLMVLNSASLAAPDSPLEDILLRAKNVVIAEVLSTDNRTVSFKTVTDLRGNVAGQFSLFLENYMILKKGSQWLLISQGDNRYGETRGILGRPNEGQEEWRGWIPLPLSKVGEKTYAAGILSFCDGPPMMDMQTPADGPFLELSRIKRLIQRFPYNPSVNK
jgi:hypothetical protein